MAGLGDPSQLLGSEACSLGRHQYFLIPTHQATNLANQVYVPQSLKQFVVCAHGFARAVSDT